MSSAVAELESILQSMLALKPPGVSGSKIQSITTLCTANVQNESVLIQKIYTHFKKAPGTHKLGVLYVVDSVTRQWIDAARKVAQPLGSNAPDGTFAAGVNRVTELLPVLMTDIISSAPHDQKEKIKKLLDIWARGQTFPASLLDSFREKLNSSQNDTTTPTGSPPLPAEQFAGAAQPVNGAAAPDTSSILKALADMAKQNTAAPVAPPVVNPLAAFTPAVPQPVPSADSTSLPAANPYAAVNTMAGPFAAMGLGQAQNQGVPPNPLTAAAQNPLAAMLPQAAAGAMPDANAMAQQLQLLQMLASQGIPQDQWAAALQIFSMTNSMGGAQIPGQMPNFNPLQGQAPVAWPSLEGQNERSQDRDREYNRSPGGYRRRSRSPGWDRRRAASPPRRRESPVYGEYGDSPGRRGGRRGNEYRQRSPVGRRRLSASPQQKDPNLPPPGPKFIEWDYSIGQGCIKVLSRTLFVGGVTSSEENLRALFNQFGLVQTCIVNNEKRHAFIKMISRQDAIAARDGMETYRSSEMQLRTRWGVGFGPRDCSDYQTGVSVIPIHRLTEADTKWMLNAEYGGTGGRTIESGMVVEEPDIEIGAGVSSKAISRRIATDTGGRRGPISTRQPNDRGFGGNQNDRGFGNQTNDRGFGGGNDRFGGARRQDRGNYDAPAGNPGGRGTPDMNANNPSVPPPVPAYGFNFPGMPMLPPGFMMGGAQAAMPSTQAPAPGQGN
ncbi:hypothetical protein N7495_000690 [Penicillium taxi]|uniref:uncharacterized protein n=1 Tax=Penicillium taxi TaxID=168475 RepID=UPI002544F3F2|nr:uncharacterized protein N7495_000690 [Penicillium taxi]KAJ5908008.1 hypothetical protein N7495_000690 [Penicillium taxi]